MWPDKASLNIQTHGQYHALFYESIYQSRENDNNNSQESVLFKAENITPLSLDDQKLCDGPITDAECIFAINGFKKLVKRRVHTVFLLNSTNFSGASFYQAFILPFKPDHSPKKAKTNHY